MADGLFDLPVDYVPPPPPEKLSRGERRKRLVASRIARGEHPLGRIRIHPDAPVARGAGVGLRCGTCRFRVLLEHHNRTYPKCHLPLVIGDRATYPRDTGCESSDIRAWWPACIDYQEQ